MGNPLTGSPDFRRLAPIKARELNRILNSLWQGQNQFPGPFNYGGRFPGGTVIVPIPSSGGGGSVSAIYPPWYPYTTKDNSGNYQANFYVGTLGGIVATSAFVPLALTQNAVNYVYGQVSASGGIVTAVTLASSTTYPTLAASTNGAPPTSFNVPLAIFDLTGATPKVYNIVGYGNIWVQPVVTLQTTTNTGGLLSSPQTQTYNWQWGAGN